MTALLDINVLIALAWPNHVHHAAARKWFSGRSQSGWATCLLTEAGFVRVSCNPRAVQHEVTPNAAIDLLERLKREGSHSFWPLDQPVGSLPGEIVARLQGYRQITDAVLVATAMHKGGELATLDARLAGLIPGNGRRIVSVIPI